MQTTLKVSFVTWTKNCVNNYNPIKDVKTTLKVSFVTWTTNCVNNYNPIKDANLTPTVKLLSTLVKLIS